MTATLEPTVATGAKASTAPSPADVIRRGQGSRSADRGRTLHGSTGHLQHFSIPLKGLEEDTFTDGLGFDGSSIRGFRPSTRATCCCSPIRPALSSTPVWKCRRSH